MSKPLRTALLVVAIGFLSCDSPTEPPAEGRVSVGQVIQGSLSSTDSSDRYTFLALAGHTYSVSFEAIAGGVAVGLRDSASGTLLAGGFDAAGGAGLEQNVTFDLRPAANQIILVEITSVSFPTTYRVRINDAPTAPEGRAARFVFGDTITEVLNPSFDVDEYVAAGQAGQEVVTLIEALGPAFTGQAVVEVTAPGATDPLTISGGVAGNPAEAVAQRVVLPTSGDYRFSVRGLGTDDQRYTGPYRLRVIVIHRAPESIGGAVPLKTAVIGEAIDDVGDIDQFTFPGTAGQWFNAFIQSNSPTNLRLEVSGAAMDPEPAHAFSYPTDTSLFKNATGRFRTLTSGSYALRVQGVITPGATAPYRLFVYPINPAPELIGSAIVPGDTVEGETVERAGDFDEFTFTGAAGTEYNAFFQGLGGPGFLQLEVWATGGFRVGSVNSFGTDTSMRQTTGRFELPTSGTHIVRVMGANSVDGDQTGPYRFLLYQVNPLPESGPDTLVFGDSVSTETIGVPGDRDEWSVTVPDSSGANLVVQLGNDAQDGTLMVDLLDSTGVTVATTTVYVANDVGISGRVTLAPGRYMVRVDPTRYYERSLMTGSYRIWLYRFKIGPETVPDTIAIGDTVSEALEPLGDIDVYRFFGTKRQHVSLALQGISGQPGGAFLLSLAPPTGAPFVFVSSPSSSAALDEHQTNRVDLPVTGWYRLSVIHSSVPGPGFADRGVYRFAVKPISTLPENAPAALAVGDSVVTESIDSAGDWDEYVVTATPGSELAVLFYRLATTQFPRVLVFDSVTLDSLSGIVGTSGVRAAGPFVVPAGGSVRVAVFEDGPGYAYTGGYYVRVVAVDRSPEVAAAALATGDTVPGEALAPLADIDEFNATGTPGQVLSPFIRLLANPQPTGRVITVEVVDPSTGNVLVGNNAGVTGASSTFFSPGTFVVPAGGAYRVRIRAGSLFPDEVATAPYEFFVRTGP